MIRVPLHDLSWPVLVGAVGLLVVTGGCQAPQGGRSGEVRHTWQKKGIIRYVRCVYDEKPWLNLDRHGDRDPEGIRYRIFLDTGDGKGVLREGTFHIEMYRIDRTENGKEQRTLVSDWHYPTGAVHTIAKPGYVGNGYFIHLRWSRKDIPGHEIELITHFEDPDGDIARSGTKRLRVPSTAPNLRRP